VSRALFVAALVALVGYLAALAVAVVYVGSES